MAKKEQKPKKRTQAAPKKQPKEDNPKHREDFNGLLLTATAGKKS
jgi:hypothetical protein